MKVDTFKCDGCGTMKGLLNHWFRLQPEDSSLGIFQWGADPESGDQHYCSDACVIKAVQGWLCEQKAAQ